MQTVFTPTISKLINLGKEMVLGSENKEEIQRSLKDAETFLQDYESIFRILSASFYKDEETKTLLDYIESNFAVQKKNLKDLKEVLEKGRTVELNPVLHKIEETGSRLESAMRDLKDVDKKEKVESPMLTINIAIKTAFNVSNGKEDATALARWMPLLISLVRRLDGDIERFACLHPEEEKMIKAAKKLIQDIKEGVGALTSFLRDKNPVSLADGLRLLKFPSRNLFIVLREMDRVAKGSSSFSRIPALEEFSLAYEKWKNGQVSWDIVEGSLKFLRFLEKLYNDVHTSLKKFPLFFSIENSWSAAQINRIQFQGTFSTFLKKLESKPKDLDLGEMKSHFESYSQSIERLVAHLEEEILKVSRAPHVEELKELVGRAVNDSIVIEYFAEKMQFFVQSHKDILQEFIKAKQRPGSARELNEIYELLVQQGKGMDEILLYFEDMNKKHLYEGMAMIEKALPPLLKIQEAVKSAIEEKMGKGKERKVICLKCGTEHHSSAKKCVKCQAMLPFAVTETTAVDTFGGEESSPLNIAHIEESVFKFENGDISQEELKVEIKSYINKLEGIRHDFENKSKSALSASGNPDIREWASSFSSNLRIMLDGLETMLLFDQSPDFLYQGMQAFEAAASELSDIRRMLKASI